MGGDCLVSCSRFRHEVIHEVTRGKLDHPSWVNLDDEYGEQYEVEEILGSRRVNSDEFLKTFEYRVSWVGYPDSDDTWEPFPALRRNEVFQAWALQEKDNPRHDFPASLWAYVDACQAPDPPANELGDCLEVGYVLAAEWDGGVCYYNGSHRGCKSARWRQHWANLGEYLEVWAASVAAIDRVALRLAMADALGRVPRPDESAKAIDGMRFILEQVVQVVLNHNLSSAWYDEVRTRGIVQAKGSTLPYSANRAQAIAIR